MSTIRTKTFRNGMLLALACLTTRATDAKDFLNPGDEAIRHHLSYLADTNELSALLTTWPLDASAVQQALDSLAAGQLSSSELQSLEALRGLLARRAAPSSASLFAHASNTHEELRGFASDSRERHEAGVSVHQDLGSGFFGKVTLAVVENDRGDWATRLDESYLAFDWNNWTLGAGRIDRWWGPGWQSSLILSNNARPSPGVFLKRNQAKAFDLPVLRHLGPWNLSLFANQLESDRHVPRAKLLGFRFAAKPTQNLEIGLSRSAQWGGENRPEDLTSLWNLIIGRDNRSDSGIDSSGSNEPGNQLGGIDWRWSTRLGDVPFAFYGQVIGEDEAGMLPSRELGMVGIEFPWTTPAMHGRLFIEASDTTMRFWDDPIPNSAYNHSIYQSGYRYYGQSIGASTDNDSRTLTIGGYHDFSDLGALTWKTIYASLNRDGVAAGNPVAPNKIDTIAVSLEYTKALTDNAVISIGGHHTRDSLAPGSGFSDTGLRASIILSR